MDGTPGFTRLHISFPNWLRQLRIAANDILWYILLPSPSGRFCPDKEDVSTEIINGVKNEAGRFSLIETIIKIKDQIQKIMEIFGANCLSS